MIRTYPHLKRVRLVKHTPLSRYVRVRRLEDGKEFDWRITDLRESVEGEIEARIARLDQDFQDSNEVRNGPVPAERA